VVSITHQLKSTIFDRFQLAVNYCITRGQMYLNETQNQACLTYITVK